MVGCEAAVIFPVLWPNALRVGAAKCLQGIRVEDAQNIVDELVGQMLAKTVKSPLAYLRALKAVSYTHLDVYKRQRKFCARACVRPRFSGAILIGGNG